MIKKTRVGVFLSGDLGLSLLNVLLNNLYVDLIFIAVCETSLIEKIHNEVNAEKVDFLDVKNSNHDMISLAEKYHDKVDKIFVFYWPFLFSKEFIEMVNTPLINFHLSLLPYNRGKNPNVWPILRGSPAGVTIHIIDSNIDSGPILFQEEVGVDILDTGESLYKKLCFQIVSLFKIHCDEILYDDYYVKENNKLLGSLNLSSDLILAKQINLESLASPLEFLNQLRAFTFPPYESAFFIYEGRKIHVRIILSEDR